MDACLDRIRCNSLALAESGQDLRAIVKGAADTHLAHANTLLLVDDVHADYF